jgi:TonB-linked SusC/RagA family outer membrane protein
MTRILSLFVVFMLTGALAFSQNQTISGFVTDGKGNPVPFATLRIVGTKSGDNADADGSFKIKTTSQKGQITVSSSGFEPKTVEFISGSRFEVELKKTDVNLETVVVTGVLGTVRQSKQLGYSTAKVGAVSLNQAAPVNLVNGLQGKVSGLNISSVNNGVTEEVKIQLRGIRSLTGDNNPMLLLDGVITDISFLSTINPRDIADVNIIKGSGGAGIYGSAARNGVFIVTTKRGARADKATVTIGRTTQFSQISFFPAMQTEFGTGFGGGYVSYENWSWGPRYDGSMKPLGSPLRDGTQQMVKYSPTNERKNFFNTGVTSQTDISLTAKDFLLSVQDANVKGIVPDDESRRLSARINADKTFGKLKISVGMNYVQQNVNIFDDAAMSTYQRDVVGAGLNDGLMNLVFNTASHIPLTSYSNLNDRFSQYDNYFNHYGLNPYFAIDNWRQKRKTDNIIANTDFVYKAATNLQFTLRVAANIKNINTRNTSKGIEVKTQAPNTNNTVPSNYNEGFDRQSNVFTEFNTNWDKKIGDFKLGVIAGTSFRERERQILNATTVNLVAPGINNLSNGSGNPSGNSFFSKDRLAAVFSQVNLSYKGWLNVEGTVRNEWASVYAPENRSIFYPGVSLSFVASDAIPALQSNKTFISFLKFTASTNRSANSDLAPYRLSNVFSGTQAGFPYNVPGYTTGNTSFDPLLRPEIIKNNEAGVQIGFFKNRVNIEVNTYVQDNSDQVISVGVSPTTGFTLSNRNAAEFKNRGIELDLKLTPLVKLGQLNFDLNLNASRNTSVVNKILDGFDRLAVGGFATAQNYAFVGQPAFVLLANDYERSPDGKVIVSSTTGVPTVNPTLKQFGRTLPLWTAGVNPTLSYKNLRLAVVTEFKTGHIAYSRIGNEMAWTGVSAATAQNGRERFVFPNSVYNDGTKLVPNTNVQVNDVESYFTGVYRDASSNFIHSAASFRIREVSLGYRLPEQVLANQKVLKDVTFTINARNLLLIVPNSNQYTDPDFNFTTGNANGVSTSQINPPTRTIGFNITATF